MAITVPYAGSGTIANTHAVSLVTPTSVASSIHAETGIYQLFIDFSNQTGLVEHEVKIYERVFNQPLRTVLTANVIGLQGDPVWTSPALALTNWDMSLQRRSATSDTAIAWSIRRIA